MEFVLRWGVLEIAAELDETGTLHYACPFCGEQTYLEPGGFKVTAREVRTLGLILCEYPRCGVPYEIVHSYFMPWQPMGLDHWYLKRRWYRPRQMHAVWKTRNERHQR